jgi:hypothetical protein
MIELLFLLVVVGLFIVPTFYGAWRAVRSGEWGWLAGIAVGWFVGLGWVVGLIFLLGPDRKARVA